MGKVLLNIDEFCEYTGIGRTKAKKMISENKYDFVVKLEGRTFIHKEILDNILMKSARYHLIL